MNKINVDQISHFDSKPTADADLMAVGESNATLAQQENLYDGNDLAKKQQGILAQMAGRFRRRIKTNGKFVDPEDSGTSLPCALPTQESITTQRPHQKDNDPYLVSTDHKFSESEHDLKLFRALGVLETTQEEPKYESDSSNEPTVRKSKNLMKLLGVLEPTNYQQDPIPMNKKRESSSNANGTPIISRSTTHGSHRPVSVDKSTILEEFKFLDVAQEHTTDLEGIVKPKKSKDLLKHLGLPTLNLPASSEAPKDIIPTKNRLHIYIPSSETEIHHPRNENMTINPEDEQQFNDAIKIIEAHKQSQPDNPKQFRKLRQAPKKIKSIASNAKLRLRNAMQKVIKHNAQEKHDAELAVESIPCDMVMASVNERLEDYMAEVSPKCNKVVPETTVLLGKSRAHGRNSFFATESPCRIIDLIRTNKAEWKNLITSATSSKTLSDQISDIFDHDYVHHMLLSTDDIAPSRIQRQSIFYQLFEQSTIKRSKYSGIDVDKIIENILGDQEFKHTLLWEPSPNQEKYPELFGSTLSTENLAFAESEDGSSLNSFEYASIDAIPRGEWFHFTFDDANPKEHPLENPYSEVCDVAELDMLFERHRKLAKARKSLQPHKSNPDLTEQKPATSIGKNQLAKLNEILESHHTLHRSKSVQQKPGIHNLFGRGRARRRSSPGKTSPHQSFHPKQKSLSTINAYLSNQCCADPDCIQEKSWDSIAKPQEIKSLVSYLFQPPKQDVILNGVGAQEMVPMSPQYTYEELWCNSETSSDSRSPDAESSHSL